MQNIIIMTEVLTPCWCAEWYNKMAASYIFTHKSYTCSPITLERNALALQKGAIKFGPDV